MFDAAAGWHLIFSLNTIESVMMLFTLLHFRNEYFFFKIRREPPLDS